MAGFITKVDNVDVDKLSNINNDWLNNDLSKLSSIVDNDVVKKSVYDELVNKVSGIDTKIPSTNGFVTNW